jgi:hypothetical protein
MKEYMFYIRNDGSELPADKEQEFLKLCEAYIEGLKKLGKLISAQPLGKEGKVISNSQGVWKEETYSKSEGIDAGYYHIRATDLNDAIAIAKENPEFVYRPSAKIEIHSIKTEEDSTGYVYPTENLSKKSDY